MNEENNKKTLEDNSDKSSLNPVVIAIVAIITVAVVVFVVFGQKHTYRAVIKGTAAPEFTLPDVDGGTLTLSELKGNIVFLNFWATWCTTCEEEMPSMEYLYRSLKGMPFEMIAISVDNDEPEVVKAFADKYNLTFPILHDRGGKIKELYKTTGVPETYIIDQNGIIAEKVWGPRNWSDPANLSMVYELLRDGPREGGKY